MALCDSYYYILGCLLNKMMGIAIFQPYSDSKISLYEQSKAQLTPV